MDSLRFLRGVSSPPVSVGIDARAHHPPPQLCAVGPRAAAGATAVETAAEASPPHSYMFLRPLRRLWPGGGGGDEKGKESREFTVEEEGEGEAEGRRGGNWVLNILRVRSLWADERGGRAGVVVEEGEVSGGDGAEEAVVEEDESGCGGGCGSEGCEVEEERVAFDRESFSRLLRRVPLVEAELYAKMSYLSNLAYTIPKIKPASLLKYHGLHFVTSSLEKKAGFLNAPMEQAPAQDREPEVKSSDAQKVEKEREDTNRMSASAAYQIAASAASYLKSWTKGILPLGSVKTRMGRDSPGGGGGGDGGSEAARSDVASFVATTNSVTAVVAGEEERKQAIAKGLNSAQSSPCEWFICDDDRSGTRCFVIQGSESLASWQTNLLFEPTQFEGLDVLVHRGIYEAAKGIYQQMLPEIHDHLKSRGKSSTLRFTGHSLGGSLALLVNLMLLIRGDAPLSSLLPVITFGAPSIICSGDYLLWKLGLPQSHIQAITMHRDIVPRAFSCNYPDHVANILTAINGNFRNHPCLKNQKLLYAPMGNLLILQPDEKFSPHHHLIPPGSGLYLLGHPSLESDDPTRLLYAAQSAFLNSPHPLEILSDRSAYGSDGTVNRDHDMSAYLRSVHGVIHQELKLIRKAKRESRRLMWWPLVATEGTYSDVMTGHRPLLKNFEAHKSNFAGVFHGGKETMKRFGRMVASQHVRMFIVLLLPARLLLLGAVPFVNTS